VNISTIGRISLLVNKVEKFTFKNQLLNPGRRFLLSNLIPRPSSSPIFIKSILFADGGTHNNEVRMVEPEMEHPFGVIRMRKEVISQVNPEVPTEALFSVTVGENEGNDFTLNEMGLELSNGDLFSLATFPDFNKTSQMALDWSWSVCFVI
jgi:hypothetical protein